MTGISFRGVSLGVGDCEFTFLRRTTLQVSSGWVQHSACRLSLFLSMRTCCPNLYDSVKFVIERAQRETNVFSFSTSYFFWVACVEIIDCLFCVYGFHDQCERIFVKEAYAITHDAVCDIPTGPDSHHCHHCLLRKLAHRC